MAAFDWDEHNIAHIARHDVTRPEVEEVFRRDPVIVLAYTQDGENRFRAHGTTARGRYLTVAYVERCERIRPITAYDMTRKDKKLYAPQIHEQE
jgi:uncharacterized DUF497 family protein